MLGLIEIARSSRLNTFTLKDGRNRTLPAETRRSRRLTPLATAAISHCDLVRSDTGGQQLADCPQLTRLFVALSRIVLVVAPRREVGAARVEHFCASGGINNESISR